MAKTSGMIAEFLEKWGPQSSSAVARHLNSFGISDTAARKMIQRAREPVRKLSGIKLPNRQRVLYHKDQYGSEAFWDQLFEVLNDSGSIYGIALSGLQAYGGSLPLVHFPRASGAPTRLRGQVGSERILTVLSDIGLTETRTYDELGPVVQFSRRTNMYVQPYLRLRARLVVESILLEALADWLRKNGLVSYGKVAVRDRSVLPEFGSHTWDLTAPSYLRPLTTRTKAKLEPGFFVADVLLGEEITKLQLRYFLRKANNLASRRGMRPTLAFLVATRFQPDALSSGRSGGLVLTTPALLFGDEVGTALLELVHVLTNAGAIAVARPEVVADLFSKLGRIEGAAGNLRGPLFELVVGHCVREVEGTTIEIGVEAVTSEGVAEIDILRVKGYQEVCVYECKGYSATKRVSLEEVDKWLGTSIPRIHKWLQNESRFRGSKVGFEFWTTGSFDPEALALLVQRASQTRKYEIRWRDGTQVEEYVKQSRNSRLLDIIREHYRNHPLSVI